MSAAASLMVLAACTDSYPTLIHNDGSSTIGNDEVYDRVPLMMFVNEQDYFSIIATRGTGVFDDEHAGKLANSLFYVYAFRAAEDADGNIVHNTDYRETSSGGTASDQDRLTAADCLLDGADYNFGMPTKLTADRNGTLEPQTTQKLYFSSAFQDVGYDFFVFHIDDFEPTAANTHREADRIYYDLEIDGSQDIMSGMAPKLTRDVLDEKIRDGKLTITKSDQEQILDIGNYCTFAAHRGVYPVMAMKHRLTRMQFLAYPDDGFRELSDVEFMKLQNTDPAAAVKYTEALERHAKLQEAAGTDRTPFFLAYFQHSFDLEPKYKSLYANEGNVSDDIREKYPYDDDKADAYRRKFDMLYAASRSKAAGNGAGSGSAPSSGSDAEAPAVQDKQTEETK